jgi:hypothetical protein
MGKQLRFAVGSPTDIRSSVWRLWGQGDELYLAAKTLAGQIKISFHKSGIARIAQTSSTPRPALSSWRFERDSLEPLARIFAILVPPILTKFPLGDRLRDNKQVICVPAPPAGSKTIFAISLASPHVTEEIILALPRDRKLRVHGFAKLKTRNAWLTSYVDDFRPNIELPVIQHYLSIVRAPTKSIFTTGHGYVHLFDKDNERGSMVTDVQLGREHFYETNDKIGHKWSKIIENPPKPPPVKK